MESWQGFLVATSTLRRKNGTSSAGEGNSEGRGLDKSAKHAGEYYACYEWLFRIIAGWVISTFSKLFSFCFALRSNPSSSVFFSMNIASRKAATRPIGV